MSNHKIIIVRDGEKDTVEKISQGEVHKVISANNNPEILTIKVRAGTISVDGDKIPSGKSIDKKSPLIITGVDNMTNTYSVSCVKEGGYQKMDLDAVRRLT